MEAELKLHEPDRNEIGAGPFTVWYDDMRLTVPIADEKRASLAYSLLYYMADNGLQCDTSERGVFVYTDSLVIKDKDGNGFRPKVDPAFDPELNPSDKERNKDDLVLCSFNEPNYTFIRFSPPCNDYNKVNELFNFMQNGINPSLSLSYEYGYRVMRIMTDGRPHNVSIVDWDNHIVTERSQRDWAQTMMPDYDFADAAANIPVNDNGLEQ